MKIDEINERIRSYAGISIQELFKEFGHPELVGANFSITQKGVADELGGTEDNFPKVDYEHAIFFNPEKRIYIVCRPDDSGSYDAQVAYEAVELRRVR